MITEIRNYITNADKFIINQKHFSFRVSLRGFIVKAQKRANFSMNKYVKSNEIRLDMYSTEYIRRWIYGLQKICKKAEKYKNIEDIRDFFAPRS